MTKEAGRGEGGRVGGMGGVGGVGRVGGVAFKGRYLRKGQINR